MKTNHVINAVKIDKTINCSINGVLYTATFETLEKSNEVYRTILTQKQNPTDDGVGNLIATFDKKIRIGMENGLFYDPSSGGVFLEDHNEPMPDVLIELFDEYYENAFPTTAIVNFWKLLSCNPDKDIRERLFDFLRCYDFSITDHGYIVTYKAVLKKEEVTNNKFNQFLFESIEKVKRWKKTPKDYYVYSLNDYEGEWMVSKSKNLDIIKHTFIDTLENLYKEDAPLYGKTMLDSFTDMHTQTMKIEPGVPVSIGREDCDANSNNECSYGLHVGATKYVERFASHTSEVLVCLISPMNVVAIPNYDNSKIRVSEYFPISVADFDRDSKKIKNTTQQYYESDYINYEIDELERLLESKKDDDKELIATSMNATSDGRDMEELKGMIKNRLMYLRSV